MTGLFPRERKGLPISATEPVLYPKRLVGSLFGEGNPRFDIPRMLRMYEEGNLKLEELITTRYALDDIVKGYADMDAGLNVRGMLSFA